MWKFDKKRHGNRCEIQFFAGDSFSVASATKFNWIRSDEADVKDEQFRRCMTWMDVETTAAAALRIYLTMTSKFSRLIVSNSLICL